MPIFSINIETDRQYNISQGIFETMIEGITKFNPLTTNLRIYGKRLLERV